MNIRNLFSKVKKEPKEIIEKDNLPATIGCYKADINCENCHILLEFELPKGTTVIGYAMNLICPNCGCNVLEWIDTPCDCDEL